MEIKYLDLHAQYLTIQNEIDAAIAGIIEKSAYILGPGVKTFEDAFAGYCQTDHCVGVNSGTSALVLALRALGAGPGTEVITAANTFIATVAAIMQCGARPVLVDVDPVSRNIDPELIESTITDRTRVIVPVHLYGRVADMDSILGLAGARQIAVLEDAAQAHGARYKGKRAGSFGTAATFSFYPGKNLGAYGEAGAIVTSDAQLDTSMRVLRDHGSEKKYYHDTIGYNARMEGLQGAVLEVKLRHLDEWNIQRNRVAQLYNRLFEGCPVRIPDMSDDHEQVFHVYAIETGQRDKLQAHLSAQGIPTLIHYPIPNHLQKALTSFDYRKGDFPVTERLAVESLSLPIYPEMTDAQVEFVAEGIRNFFG